MKEGAKMTCEDCIHYNICTFHLTGNENEKCMQFLDKADVVEVVRCKDCEWWEPRTYGSCVGRCQNPDNGLYRDYTDEDDYCSYGKGKEQE